MRIFTAIIIAALLLGVGVMWRWWHIFPGPMGGGQYHASPNGNYEAQASALSCEDFWGHKKDYYEFRVVPKGSYTPIKIVRMDILAEDTFFDMRTTNRIIHWADDSKSVAFAFLDKEIIIHLEQGVAPYGAQSAPSGER